MSAALCRDHDILGHRVAVSSCIGADRRRSRAARPWWRVDPGANVTDRPPGTLPDGRCRDERRGGESGDDDRAHGDDPSGPDERSRASPSRTSAATPATAGPRSIAGHRCRQPTRAGGAPGSRAFDGRDLDRGEPQPRQRADDLVPVDLGKVELRQADLLDGELRHLTSSSVRVDGLSRIRPSGSRSDAAAPSTMPAPARYSTEADAHARAVSHHVSVAPGRQSAGVTIVRLRMAG